MTRTYATEQPTQTYSCPDNVVKVLAPIEIPFVSEFLDVADQTLAARGDNGEQPGEGEGSDTEDDHIMPGGSAGWGPVSGGYWGLDGQFHVWTDTPPPMPQPLPPLTSQPTDQPSSDTDSSADSTTETSPEEDAEAEERRRRIRELEEEMHRILEEMQIMWPLCEDLLQDEFERRREEILRLDPTWTPPGVTPLHDDDEAPPLHGDDEAPELPFDEPPELPFETSDPND